MCGRDPPPTPDPVPTADNSNSSATPTSTGTAKAPVKPTSTGTTKAPAAAAGADNDGGVGTSTIAATIAAVLVVLVSVVVGYHYWQRRAGTDRPANAGEAGGARPGGGRQAGHTVENAAFERPGNAPDRGKSGSGARMRARETQNNPAGLQSTHGGQRAEQLSRAAGDPDYNYHDVLEFDAASHEYSSIAPVSEGACDHDHPDADKYATETTRQRDMDPMFADVGNTSLASAEGFMHDAAGGSSSAPLTAASALVRRADCCRARCRHALGVRPRCGRCQVGWAAASAPIPSSRRAR